MMKNMKKVEPKEDKNKVVNKEEAVVDKKKDVAAEVVVEDHLQKEI